MRARITPCGVAFAIAIASIVFGDEIHLKNGNTITGLIVQETATTYVIDLGFGTTEIETSRVRTVDRSESENGQSMREAWQRKYFLQKRYVPDAQTGIAGTYRRLLNQRARARAARKEFPKLRAAIAKARADIQIMEKRRIALGEQLQSAELDAKNPAQVLAYNKLVTENNILSSKRSTTYQEIRTNEQRIKDADKSVGTYTRELEIFNQHFTNHRAAFARRGRTNEEDVFLNEMARRLEGFNKEFRSYKVATRQRGNGILVTVRFNDSIDATYMLDTGASFVTLTPALAQRLQLDTSQVQPAQLTVADGRRVSALPVLLKSVAAGGARMERVEAVVMEGAAGTGFEGLLGMSFLRGFLIEVDPGTSSLALKRLER
jgi:clan AA aspartic protease (TIGR02281 family)